jgi:type I restriction enzyme S subunit
MKVQEKQLQDSKIPKGYKQTEVGVIPEDWVVRKIDDSFSISGGFSASRDDLGSIGHFYLHYGGIHGSKQNYMSTLLHKNNIPKIDIELNKISPNSFLEDGDIVFVDASEDLDGTSKYIVIRNPENKIFISGLHTIIAKHKNGIIHKLFREYLFHSKKVKDQFRYFAVGTKVSGISKSTIKKITFPLPLTLAEQEKIAEVLSDMDAEIEKIEAKIEKYKYIKKGMMQKLLTGQLRLV